MLTLFPLGRVTASYDELTSTLATAGFVTQSLLTPRSLRGGTVVLTTTDTVTATVTTTMRVVGGIHDDTADSWADALVAIATGLTDLDVLVLLVADNSETSGAIFVHQAEFAARQT
jgi:hypothetical protein